MIMHFVLLIVKKKKVKYLIAQYGIDFYGFNPFMTEADII